MFFENRRTWVEVDVNDRVNLYVAVNLKVWVDVEVLVEVHDSTPRARMWNVRACETLAAALSDRPRIRNAAGSLVGSSPNLWNARRRHREAVT